MLRARQQCDWAPSGPSISTADGDARTASTPRDSHLLPVRAVRSPRPDTRHSNHPRQVLRHRRHPRPILPLQVGHRNPEQRQLGSGRRDAGSTAITATDEPSVQPGQHLRDSVGRMDHEHVPGRVGNNQHRLVRADSTHLTDRSRYSHVTTGSHRPRR
jgi:hypothetical protein